MRATRPAAILVIVLGLVAGFLLLAFLAPSTSPGADLAVYQQAGLDITEHGDPYFSSPSQPDAFQYRYPPLLAMFMPVLGWPPLWYAILVVATLATFLIGFRLAGWAYLLPIWVLGAAWGQSLVNGSVQPIVVLLLAIVPLRQRTGAIALAAATMLTLHPGLGIIWYLGRRDWIALRWYLVAVGALLIVQAPWLSTFVGYSTTPGALPFGEMGIGLLSIHPSVWVVGSILIGVLAYQNARSPNGWLLAVVFQLAALPRVLLTTLSLLLAAPIRARAKAPPGG